MAAASLSSNLRQQIQTMTAYASQFTQVQVTAANLSYLTQDQRTWLAATAAAHDAAVDAANVAMKAAEDADKAGRLAEEQKKAAEEYQKDYEKTKDAELAAEKAMGAEALAVEAMVAANKAAEDAAEAMEKANQAESDYAKMVLKADLTAEDARVVRMFGSGIIPERTFRNKNHSSEYLSCGYSILAKFIRIVKETKCVDLLADPRTREVVVELGNCLKAYGFKGKWLSDVRKALRNGDLCRCSALPSLPTYFNLDLPNPDI